MAANGRSLGETDATYSFDTGRVFSPISRQTRSSVSAAAAAVPSVWTSSDKAVSVAEMIDLVVGLAGCREPVEHDSDRLRAGASKVRSLLADSGRVSAVGWQPSVDLCEGLRRTIAWWRDRLSGGLVRRDREFIT